MKIWLVYCPSCGKACTGAKPPGHADFEKKVQCVICGKELDASNGKFIKGRFSVKKEPVDLLSVL